MKHRILAIFTAFILVLSAVPASAATPDFTIDPETGYITAYNGSEVHVTVPSVVDGVAVLGIGDAVFRGDSKLLSVVLPEGLTYIGEEAFYSCTALSSVTLPSTLKIIGRSAFMSCVSLMSVDLPEGLEKITTCAFRNCLRLRNIVIPETVTELEGWVFWNCTNLTSINIPLSIRAIPSGIFYLCSSLTSVTFSQRLYAIGTFSLAGCTSLKTFEIPETVKTIGEGAFDGCKALTLYCLSDSYAAEYCAENSLRCILTEPQISFTVNVSPQRVYVDGKEVAFEIYNIDGSNYFKLRDLAYVLMETPSSFSVGFDDALKTVTLGTGGEYVPVGGELTAGSAESMTATTTNDKLIIDGVSADIDAYKIGGSNYFRLRDLGSALGFGVDYDADVNCVVITSREK